MALSWNSTVFGLRNRLFATSLFVAPAGDRHRDLEFLRCQQIDGV